MKLKVIDNGTGQVVFEKQELSSVSFSIDGGDFVARSTSARPRGGATDSATIPFGADKGKPIAGASKKTLEFLRKYCDDALANPDKERFRESNEAMLSSVLAEMKRQGIDNIDAPF